MEIRTVCEPECEGVTVAHRIVPIHRSRGDVDGTIIGPQENKLVCGIIDTFQLRCPKEENGKLYLFSSWSDAGAQNHD
jgi:hypothetical protein